MASSYKTPGVYVEEISKFPPSVAEVATAIPAFVGYTEKAKIYVDGDLIKIPTRIKSLLEYEQYFGKGPSYTSIHVQLTAGNIVDNEKTTIANAIYNLYESMRLYFDNGGGVCYVCCAGIYSTNGSDATRASSITSALAEVRKFDEPTLLLFPDAANIKSGSTPDWDKIAGIQQAALKQCGDLGDRFAILDVPEDGTGAVAEADKFRSKVGMNNLKYGAAYTPFVKTIYDKNFRLRDIAKNMFDSVPSPIKLKSLFSDSDLDANKVKIKDKLDAFEALYTDNDNINSRFAIFSGKAGSTIFDSSNLDTIYQTYVSKFNGAAAGVAGDADRTAALASAFTFIYTCFAQFEGLVESSHSGNTDTGTGLTTAANAGMVTVGKPIRTITVANAALLSSMQGILATNLKTALQTFINLDNEANKSPGGKISTTAPQSVSIFTDASWLPAVADPGSALISGTTLGEKGAVTFTQLNTLFSTLKSAFNSVVSNAYSFEDATEKALLPDLPVINSIVKVLNTKVNTLPPSGAIAGVYASVDRDRGVWKAPANVTINSVSDLSELIDDNDQEVLNIDANAGKSVNAIRAFYGKGITVWGARTLAGNDNEWRYVPVRRLFSFAEESCKKSTSWCVFEPNDANTWARIRSQIDNFLNNLWRRGALAGAKPEQAYFVNCGLNITMTALDILEGRLIIEIGMAAVRPAEFVILRFSHKLQES